jgi:hypothetical protein
VGLRFDIARMKLGTASKGRGPSSKVFLCCPDGVRLVTRSALSKWRRQEPKANRTKAKRIRKKQIKRTRAKLVSQWTVMTAGQAIMVDPWSLPKLPANAADQPHKSGVYFIFLGSELVYIGQSKNIRQRLSGHEVVKVLRLVGSISTSFILVDTADLNYVEYSLIKTFYPRANQRMSPYDMNRFIRKRQQPQPPQQPPQP